ncbi:SagB/ThcOx family dehydrogenase [Paenibacillus profundus]|uniref:SagB/ThcOx family dehydrogenase n=1 Tax=Paenibacillus profundus TaxID=1173085 RepID=A0ABS8YGC6_9BACL|nr:MULTISPECIES: SagB/ThcOx family dehydrogenase [Paenibacillus]MCE5170627.1 SagB/ThcOx family dehydrogenase [Paenibacillus profundus]
MEGITIAKEYLWDLENDRSLLRRFYHKNSNSTKEFSSVNLKNLRSTKSWEIKPGITLPSFTAESEFEQLLRKRRTRRFQSKNTIDIVFIAKLLQFCAGITDHNHNLFSYPSPGALYPCTLFISMNTSQHDYVYRYNPYMHTLEEYALDQAKSINNVILDEELKKFPLKLYFSSDYQLLEEKYGELSYRLLCQEIGHIAQNISLYCEHKNFNSVCIGGFVESVFQSVVDDKYDLHYVMVVG